MALRLRNGTIAILLVLGYAVLLSGGRVPGEHWQRAVVATQSLLLTFLTCYVGRSALYIRHSEASGKQRPKEIMVEHVLSEGLQQLPCAILLVEAESRRLQFANHAAFTFFGLDWLPASQLTQRRVEELFKFSCSDQQDALTADPIGQAVQKRELIVTDGLVIKRPNSGAIRALVTSIPLLDEQGNCASVMVSVVDMTESHRQLKKIEDIAYADPLTGLANRLSILQRIQESFDRPDAGHFALLFLDFDRFKLINDSLGHDVGDQLLIEIAKRIKQSIRSSDFISIPARLGGDEFVVLLERLPDPNIASEVADRVLAAVNRPYHLAGHSIVSTASIGVVTSSQGADSASDMLRQADLAMYKSKTEGKARYSMFDDSLKRHVEQRLLLETELRSAIKYDEFDFDVQPIVHLETREPVGGEALLRWQHPRLNRVSANQFLGVACETGLIVPIGDQMLRKAASFVQSREPLEPNWRLHVNISRLQLLVPQLLDVLDEVVAEAAIDPSRLVFEIAEISINDELDQVAERCRQLKERGVRLCLDNFGSGASSLALLRKLPLDCLKLDRSIVQGMDTSPENLVMLEALLTIAKNYKIQVIAEGIESDSQRVELLKLGCEYGQGYAFRAPVPASEFQINQAGKNVRYALT